MYHDLYFSLYSFWVYQENYPELLTILKKVVDARVNVYELFKMEQFIALLDLLKKDSIRVDAARSVLQVRDA